MTGNEREHGYLHPNHPIRSVNPGARDTSDDDQGHADDRAVQ